MKLQLQSACPAVEEWKEFLKEASPGKLRPELAEHLEGCARCQATVDRLCKGSVTWLQIAERWKRPVPGSLPGPATANTQAPASLEKQQSAVGLVVYTCPRCKKTLRAQRDQAGSKHDCPSCGQRLQIPNAPARPELKKTVLGEPIPEKKTILAEPASTASDNSHVHAPERVRPIPARPRRFNRAVIVGAAAVLLLGSCAAIGVLWMNQKHQQELARIQAEVAEAKAKAEAAEAKARADAAEAARRAAQDSVRPIVVQAAPVNPNFPPAIEVPKDHITTINVGRKDQLLGGLLGHNLYINGQYVGRIGNGATKSFQFLAKASGGNVMYVETDEALFGGRDKSNTVTLDVPPGCVVNAYIEFAQNGTGIELVLDASVAPNGQ